MMEAYYLIFFVICMGLWGLVIKKELLSMVLSYVLTMFSLAVLMLAISFGPGNEHGYFFAVVLIVTTVIEVTVALAWCKKAKDVQGSLSKII